MTYLKFYSVERERFRDASKTTIPDRDLPKFARKIARHFKVELYEIRIRGYGDSGSASRYFDSIRLSHNPSVLLIVHEIGHLYTRQKLGEQKHNKKLMSFIKKAVGYAERNDYWNMQQTETEKRLTTEKRQIQRLNKRSLRALTKCPNCGYVTSWNLSDGYRGNLKWAKEQYSVNSKHEITCYRCKIRSVHRVIELVRLTSHEAHDYTEKLSEKYVYPLVVVNFISHALAIPQTRALTVMKSVKK